jgi:uncharacterized repeat protein (TIGR03943 family)
VVVALTVGGGTISLLAGAVLLRLTLTGAYTRYVRVGMGPWLAVAGAVAAALGAVIVIRAVRRVPSADGHGHDESGTARAGWLLLLPIAALLLVAPPPLGSYGVDRGAAVEVRAGAPVFDPLPAGSNPIPMTLLEYAQRVVEHEGASLAGTTVELTGFVAGAEEDGFRLARFQIACCAADAVPVVVRVVGVSGDLPARDAWVMVTGRFEPTGGWPPQLLATSVKSIPTPEEPYE